MLLVVTVSAVTRRVVPVITESPWVAATVSLALTAIIFYCIAIFVLALMRRERLSDVKAHNGASPSRREALKKKD